MLFVGTMVAGAAQYPGWLIPDGGRDEKSPMSSAVGAATRGKALYASNCARCHGPEGKGDGVLFYKIWNGRIKEGKGPSEDMPAFQGKLGKDQVWTLVEYLKVLRTPRR